jgi:predicted short-subunit dehydrogenase-like oxidoreductase (DUF2520 family)
VVSRNASAATKLAYEWDTESTNYISLINKKADFYLVAVTDDAIHQIVSELKLPAKKVVAHTAASVSKDVLKPVAEHYGVFYPLQSLRKEIKTLPDVPVFFDGNDAVAKKLLENLAHSIAQEKVAAAGDDARMKLHVAAVIVSNFTNHLYTLAEEYCRKEGLNFTQLLPLIEETAVRIKTVSPRQAQTGPAIRHDKETLHKHIELLKDHPQLKNIYILLTESIQQTK